MKKKSQLKMHTNLDDPCTTEPTLAQFYNFHTKCLLRNLTNNLTKIKPQHLFFDGSKDHE